MWLLYYFLCTVSTIGIIGNLIVTYVYIRKGDKHTASFFILVLAFSDLIVCSILVPSTVYMEYVDFFVGSTFYCKLHYFITTTIVPSCCFLMTAIAFDRYFCICQANNNIITLQRAKLLVGLIIFISILLGIIPSLSAIVETSSADDHFNKANLTVLNTSNNSNNTIETFSLCYIDFNSQLGYYTLVLKAVMDGIYVIDIVVITILYVMIYEEIYTRRKKKEDRKRELLMTSLRHGASNKESNFCKGAVVKNRSSKKELARELDRKNSLVDDLNSNTDATLKQNLLEAARNKSQIPSEQNFNQNNTRMEDVPVLPESEEPSVPVTICSKLLKESRKASTNTRTLISSKDVRTALMLFVVTFLYILFFSPSMIATYYNLIQSLNGRSVLGENDKFILIFYLYYMNSAINPMIYCFLNPTFRKDLTKIFFSRDSCYNTCFLN